MSKDCFKGHKTKAVLDAAIDQLLACNPPRIVVETVARPKGVTGTPIKIYKLAAKSAKCAKREEPPGLAGDSGLRTASETCETSLDGDASFRTVRTVREATDAAQDRTNAHSSLVSHISQSTFEKVAATADVEGF